MFVASLLTEEPCIFKSVPAIGELDIVIELLKSIGSQVEIAGPTASVSTPLIKNNRVTQLSRKNRIPILALGPLLARTGEAEVPMLGGDKIGPRPVDIHLEGLSKLGAKIETTGNSFHATAPKEGLTGAEIELRFPSVGATENIMLAAVLAHGKTMIKNAALEPEIIDLMKLLQKMGAIIELCPPRTITIEGVFKNSRHDGACHARPQRSGLVCMPRDRDERPHQAEGRDSGTFNNIFKHRAAARRRIRSDGGRHRVLALAARRSRKPTFAA